MASLEGNSPMITDKLVLGRKKNRKRLLEKRERKKGRVYVSPFNFFFKFIFKKRRNILD